MKKFIIKKNKYLDRDIIAYYNCEYFGYQQHDNPDFINHLKNMSNKYKETDLVKDFIEVVEMSEADLKKIIKKLNVNDLTICVIPRSKSEKKYKQSQLMFKKAISCIADSLGLENGTDAIKRIKDTKTTHNWRLENNNGKSPYVGIRYL